MTISTFPPAIESPSPPSLSEPGLGGMTGTSSTFPPFVEAPPGNIPSDPGAGGTSSSQVIPGVAGIPGPAGAAGATGPAGPTGPQGPAGSGAIVSDGSYGDITVSGIGTVYTISNGVVTLAKMANMATLSLIGRNTAATGVPEIIGVGGGIEFTGSGALRTTSFTGDVTKSAGGTSLTVANLAVTYAKIQNVSATSRFLGRITAGPGVIEELTGTQATTLLDVFTSGAKGLVPASGGGTTTFLRADNSFATPLAGPNTAPAGRLSLVTNTFVHSSTVTGATTVYYNSRRGRWAPLYSGSNFIMVDLGGELSQALSDTTKSPAAAVGWAAYDMFLWDDAGTKRCTRGPAWIATSTITVTIASPAVVSWTAHGLHEGDPVIFTTTSALPTGIVAGTVYFVSRSPATDTFNIATTVANGALSSASWVNTSGSQSGVHTGTCRVRSRGVGAGTTELDFSLEFPTNKNAITNGPTANKGTYVGTVLTNAAGTIDFTYGSLAAGGGKAVLSVWNAYNRFRIRTMVNDSTDNEAYATATWKPFLNSVNNSVDFIVGLVDEAFDATMQSYMWNSAAVQSSICVGYDSTNTFTGMAGSTGTTQGASISTVYGTIPDAGRHTVTGLEFGSAGAMFSGDFAVPAQGGSGISFALRM